MRGFPSPLLVLLLLLPACAQERTHPRIADVTSPFHISVRVVDVEVQKECGAIPAFTDKVQCWFSKANREGCTYVALGESADLPIAFTGPATSSHCDFQRMRTNTAILTREPKKVARIFFDGPKARVLIHMGDEGWLLFLKDQRLLTQEQLWNAGTAATAKPLMSDDTPDWSRVPTLLTHLDAVSFDLSSKELEVLMRTDPKPEEHLRDALIRGGRLLVDIPAFDGAMKRLTKPDQQLIIDALGNMVTDGDTLAMDWFRAHPEQKDLFGTSLMAGLINGSMNEPGALSELLKLNPKDLESSACDALERNWHERLGYGYYEGANAEVLTSPLAVLATRKSKCPWVVPLLESVQCDLELRCAPAETDDDSEVERDPLIDQQRPLCTEAQIARAIERNTKPTRDDAEGEQVPQYHDWGPLLLAAAKAQGPIPEELLQRNARRLYAWKHPKRPVPEEGEEPPYDACESSEIGTDRWVCTLPRTVTKAFNAGCHLEIDDAKKVINFVADIDAEQPLDEADLKRPIPY